MMHKVLLHELRSQSTWRLFGLGMITYGTYYAHYILAQTPKINRRLEGAQQIPAALTFLVLFLSYLSLALFVGYLFVDEHHPIATASNIFDRAWMIACLVWSFYARNRMNTLLEARPGDQNWFHGFWTFLLSPLYFNYKVNVLNETEVSQAVV